MQLLAEDSFQFGLTLLQFVCALTNDELKLIRTEPLEIPEGRLKNLVEDISDNLINARSKNLPKFAEAVIKHLAPEFPATYRDFIISLLHF